jgi:hypothetical protein
MRRDLTPNVNCFESCNDPDQGGLFGGPPIAVDHPNSTSPNDKMAVRNARIIGRAMMKHHRRAKHPRTLEWFMHWEVSTLSSDTLAAIADAPKLGT